MLLFPPIQGIELGECQTSGWSNDLDFDLLELTNDKVLEVFKRDNPDMMLANVLRVMDIRLNYRSNFPDFPLREYLKNNFAQIDGVPLVNAVDGDLCGKCERGLSPAVAVLKLATLLTWARNTLFH